MKTGICFQCGKRLTDAVGRPVKGAERLVGGNHVRLHDCCAKTFDNDMRRVVTIAEKPAQGEGE